MIISRLVTCFVRSHNYNFFHKTVWHVLATEFVYEAHPINPKLWTHTQTT